MGPYRLIVMDPNWPEKGGGKSKRGADRWYECANNVEDLVNCICGMRDPDGRLAYHPDPEGCQVWIWTTTNQLSNAFELMDRLNLTYITSRVWVKGDVYTPIFRMLFEHASKVLPKRLRDKLDKAITRGVFCPQAFGLGQYIRGLHEFAILAYARGGMADADLVYSEADDSELALLCRSGRTKTHCRRVPSVLVAPRTAIHSEKPAEFYADALKIAGGGPAMDMFARDARPGYHCAGDEVGTEWRENHKRKKN